MSKVNKYYQTTYQSPIGMMTIACHGGKICGLWFENQKYYLGSLPEQPVQDDSPEVFAQVKNWLDRYFSGKKPEITELPLAPTGTEFRRMVWDILCEIPYGRVITYGEIAKEVAGRMNIKSMSAQAVGGAVGHNPISVIIPCHRVVGAKGSLTGFAGGIDRKIYLLRHEGADMSYLFVPKNGTAL